MLTHCGNGSVTPGHAAYLKMSAFMPVSAVAGREVESTDLEREWTTRRVHINVANAVDLGALERTTGKRSLDDSGYAMGATPLSKLPTQRCARYGAGGPCSGNSEC